MFVRQQYRDFLNREADAAGLAFWKNNIDKCNDRRNGHRDRLWQPAYKYSGS